MGITRLWWAHATEHTAGCAPLSAGGWPDRTLRRGRTGEAAPFFQILAAQQFAHAPWGRAACRQPAWTPFLAAEEHPWPVPTNGARMAPVRATDKAPSCFRHSAILASKAHCTHSPQPVGQRAARQLGAGRNEW